MKMRTTKTMTVSLPPEMLEEFERVRKRERRTRSELVREALRVYFARIPAVAATAAELEAIHEGEAEIERGEFVTLTELLHGMGTTRRKERPKVARKNPR
jgi:predicted transcriptional regulator